MDNDSGDRTTGSRPRLLIEQDGEVGGVSVKLVTILLVVLILSFGVVGCTFFFIYMCFLHPEAAIQILQVAVPGALAWITAVMGKKAIKMSTDKLTKKPDEKEE